MHLQQEIERIAREWRIADQTPALYGTKQLAPNEWGKAYHKDVRLLLDAVAQLEHELEEARADATVAEDEIDEAWVAIGEHKRHAGVRLVDMITVNEDRPPSTRTLTQMLEALVICARQDIRLEQALAQLHVPDEVQQYFASGKTIDTSLDGDTSQPWYETWETSSLSDDKQWACLPDHSVVYVHQDHMVGVRCVDEQQAQHVMQAA